MKPKDFRWPSEHDGQVPFVFDRLMRLPKKKLPEDSSIINWHHPEIFDNTQKIYLEYCSGNGTWIASKASVQADKNWVAVEMKLGRARKIWSKIKNLQLNNLFVVNGEANLMTTHYLLDQSIEHVFINFPDPWPKRHHAKYRLIQPSFVEQLARILKPNGSVTFVTDDEPYSKWTIDIFMKNESFVNDYPDPYFTLDWPNYGESYFDDLWRTQGKTIRYHRFTKMQNLNLKLIG